MPFVILCAFLCTSAVDVKAASLFGKVIEVNSGDVITIHNLNRAVRIRLLGVDAPEMDQAFGDVAKRHLVDLVYDKSVLVEYAGIASDSSLTGRVLLGSTDIGAQMIRDGAAWVDPGNQHRLNATDQEVYQRSEQAARSERRGLWHEENPIAPWEFVKAVALRRNPVASSNGVVSGTQAKRTGATPELTNLSLMMARMNGPGSAQANRGPGEVDTSGIMSSTRKSWRMLNPDGENFTALVPDEGVEVSDWVPFGAEEFEEKTYVGRDGWNVYGIGWTTVPTYGETHETAMNGWLDNYVRESNKAQQKRTGLPNFKCKPRGHKYISVNGYTGLEFDMSSCPIPSRVRVYTKVIGEMRQIYMGAVIYMEQDENVSRFLDSFTVGTPRKPKPTTNKQK